MFNRLIINSKDRIAAQSQSSTNFVVQFKQLIENSKCMTLESVQIPNEIYNITASNNIIDFNDGTATVAATIPVGAYSINGNSSTGALLTVIGTTMTTASAGHGALTFTATYSATTHFVTISAGGSFTILFASGTNAAKSIANSIGFTAADTASATSAVGTQTPNLSYPYNIQLNVKGLGGCLTTANTFATFTIPVNGNTGDVISYSICNGWIQSVNPGQPFNTLEVQLLVDGTTVDIRNADWCFILRVE